MKFTQVIIFVLIWASGYAQDTTITLRPHPVDKEQLKDHKRFQHVKLPKFILADTSNRILNLHKLKGKTIVMHFWYTHCTPCIADMPYYKEAISFFEKDTTVAFISICVDKGINKPLWKKMINHYRFTDSHVFLDLDKPVEKQNIFYKNIGAYPTYMVIDTSFSSLGCLTNVDDLLGFTYEVDQSKNGILTSTAFIKMMKAEKSFYEWINGKGKIFLKR